MGIHLTSYIDPPSCWQRLSRKSCLAANRARESDDRHVTLLAPPGRRLRRRPRNLTLEKFVTYGCKCCRTHLSSSLQIISRDYHGRTGDAYLISHVCNVAEDKVEMRSMLTGDYLVCDIVCNLCKSLVGWKYLESERAEQKYKEGKYILELETICKCT
ncbi:Moh1p KNAG_0F03660 [Huiozyma naganishii CBS 8797]|uniref:Protein yippee-like n=1 Tax=Huiozyma naganishii (strain ATCC MYA-139 / BCRC 22969 / CBS 8797 / KCTC 17520 / NBRC 10181 / NCYC 3082 / Yp74L-3) TaxID=1071383 RepID=J7RNB6_HUIN7|nr:hypothetical protein KNAG_0F03660 [Kazachstania naganishii CBS 8797]CCK71028.1 hypothetical protein KNAG_0F03660 [Kazachstania naganishii CBS 8797]